MHHPHPINNMLIYAIEHICRTFGQNYGILTFETFYVYNLYSGVYGIWHII